jgi:hypothetical protein
MSQPRASPKAAGQHTQSVRRDTERGGQDDRYLFSVPQTSKSAVPQVSKPAGDSAVVPAWKPAIQQVWKPAARNLGRFALNRYDNRAPKKGRIWAVLARLAFSRWGGQIALLDNLNQ